MSEKPDYRRVLAKAKELNDTLQSRNPPPEEGGPSVEEPVLYFSLVRGTRTYIEKLVHQINGTYSRAWYDACAVMIRRLLETLIIEAFEANNIANSIKNPQGDFLYLGDLITAVLREQSWNLSRNTKRALKELKDVGDKSAHSRRFVAHRQDIDKVTSDLRTAVQELTFLAKLK